MLLGACNSILNISRHCFQSFLLVKFLSALIITRVMSSCPCHAVVSHSESQPADPAASAPRPPLQPCHHAPKAAVLQATLVHVNVWLSSSWAQSFCNIQCLCRVLLRVSCGCWLCCCATLPAHQDAIATEASPVRSARLMLTPLLVDRVDTPKIVGMLDKQG